MAEQDFTLSTFYASWKEYQEHIRNAVATLTAEQLALRAAPNLRSIGENAAHIIGCRAGWFTQVLGEDGAEMKDFATWDEKGALARTGEELAHGIDRTWEFMAERLARWDSSDMRQTFTDDWDGVKVELSRAWIIWHIIEHDMHHGGEVSLTCGMHGIKADFPG